MELKDSGDKGLGGNKELQDLLGTSFKPAQASLRALLGKQASLSSEQTRKLKQLVGPQWTRLKADIEQYKAWSAEAVELVRTIDGTPRAALTDTHWSAILSQAREAAENAQVAAGHIKLSSPPAAAAESGGVVENPRPTLVRKPKDLSDSIRHVEPRAGRSDLSRTHIGYDCSSPHPCGIYGAVRPAKMLDSMALGW